jgi:hypothetical protein
VFENIRERNVSCHLSVVTVNYSKLFTYRHVKLNCNAYRILVGKHEGKRPFRRPRHRWEDYIEIDPEEIGLQ